LTFATFRIPSCIPVMDTEEVKSLVDDLAANITDLETSLAPLLTNPLSTTASTLPLLDKAKLHILATYTLESLLFSALRLNGIDAKSHPVFAELSRVKEYFAKIKAAEGAGQKRKLVVDKDAAGRMVKAGVGDGANGRKRKLEEIATGKHTRFDGMGKRMKAEEERVPVVRAQDADSDAEEDASGVDMTAEDEKAAKREAKRARRAERKAAEVDGPEAMPATARAGAAAGVGRGNADLLEPDGDDAPQSQGEGKMKKKRKRKTRDQMQQDLEERRAEEMR